MSVYHVDKESMVMDYVGLAQQREAELTEEMSNIDVKVQNKLDSMRPEVYESVKREITNAVNEKYAEKEAFYKKYISIAESSNLSDDNN